MCPVSHLGPILLEAQGPEVLPEGPAPAPPVCDIETISHFHLECIFPLPTQLANPFKTQHDVTFSNRTFSGNLLTISRQVDTEALFSTL